MSKMESVQKLEMLGIDEIMPYENNPRINDGAVKYVKDSIREFGFKIPIVVDENRVILAGHTRHKAARELKMATVPCVIARGLTEEQKRAYRIADNRAGELTEFDFEKVYNEIAAITIEAPEMNMGMFGFEEMKARNEGGEKMLKAEDENGREMVYCPRCGKIVNG